MKHGVIFVTKELHQMLKVEAAKEGITMGELVAELLTRRVNGQSEEVKEAKIEGLIG